MEAASLESCLRHASRHLGFRSLLDHAGKHPLTRPRLSYGRIVELCCPDDGRIPPDHDHAFHVSWLARGSLSHHNRGPCVLRVSVDLPACSASVRDLPLCVIALDSTAHYLQ